MRTPIDFLIAWVKASVLLISREYISEPAMLVNGVSWPSAWAIPIAIAVFPGRNKKFQWLPPLYIEKKFLYGKHINYSIEKGVTCSWLTSKKNSSTSNFTFLYHFKDNSSSSSGSELSHHSLRYLEIKHHIQIDFPQIAEKLKFKHTAGLTWRGSRLSSRPRPRMCEWAPILSMRVISRTSCTLAAAMDCQQNVIRNMHRFRHR